MRGGARHGAGRPGWKAKVESLLVIDARDWSARGLLSAGNAFGWRWQQNGEQIFSVNVQVSDTSSIAICTDGNIRQTIRLMYTPCNYGGKRVWFSCPHCGDGMAKLYWACGQWYCRKSLNLAYASASMGKLDRIHRRLARLQSKLGEGLEKPKGMHWETYDRIIQQWRDTVAYSCQAP